MRREEGMTIVEVVVAGLILMLGALGVLGVVDAASRNTYRAEQSQVVANVLQGEMEKLRQIPYAELALTELPAHSSDPEDPDSRISSTSFYYTGRNGTGLKQLVYNGGSDGGETIAGGTVDPGPTSFQVGDVNGTINRYVVWDTCPASLCADGRHLRRVVVTVSLAKTGSGGTRRYQEVQGQFVDPKSEPSTFPSQEPGGNDTVPWTLWLTDTPCSESARQPLPPEDGNHASHNTRADCAQGVQEGVNVPGAPDLLWPVGPDEEGAGEEEEELKYDYATDVEPQPEGDHGLQLLSGGECGSAAMRDLAVGVATEPDEADPGTFRKVHRWLSPPVPEGEGSDDLLLTGTGTLSLWTRTVGGTPYQGRICAWLFVRSYEEGGAITDTLAVNLGPPLSLHFERFETSWPSGGWTELTLPLGFGYAEEGGALPLSPGDRLGLAIAIGGDTPSGLQIIYDTPSYESKLHLATTGAEPPGP